MLSLRRPNPARLARFLDDRRGDAYSYAAVGATQGTPPAGFDVDHTRVALGRGLETFEAAKDALGHWRQTQLGWLSTWPAEAPVKPGQNLALVNRMAGLWWLSACRIVYVIDEREGPRRRFGMAYGTLGDHVERGEERFLVEWNEADDTVWYDVLAFSRPRHILAKLGYPLARRGQARFRRESPIAMRRAVDL